MGEGARETAGRQAHQGLDLEPAPSSPGEPAHPGRRWAGALGAVGRAIVRGAREPLAQFFVLGLALFIAGRIYERQTSVYRIVVTRAHIEELAKSYALQFGERPDRDTLTDLVRRDLHDEILFREGIALKLDQGDQIVRRRIVQKMQFLMQDLNAPAEPTHAQLQAYFNAHASRYAAPVRVTFSHIYFSADKRGEEGARVRAQAVLRTLSERTNRAPERGDPFPDLYDFSAYEPQQIARVFGKSPFADAVLSAPPGRWAGPFRSGYGWHLLFVSARTKPALAALPDVQDGVRSDYLEEEQSKANAAAFKNLARRFTVVGAAGAAVSLKGEAGGAVGAEGESGAPGQ